MEVVVDTTEQRSRWWREFRRGVLAMAPILAGVGPIGVAIAVSAQAAGFTPVETMAFSGLIFAGAAQAAAISLLAGGASAIAIVMTVLFFNLRHILYGLSLDRQLPERPQPPRPILAFFLTDEAYGLTTRDHLNGRGGAAFYMGAAVSLYVVYIAGNLAGVLLGSFLPDPDRIGLNFIFPLLFIALLIPLLRSRRQILIAGVAGVIAMILGQFTGSGVTVLVTTILAATFGAWMDGRDG